MLVPETSFQTESADSDDEELDELELRRIALASAIPRMEESSHLTDENSSQDMPVSTVSAGISKLAQRSNDDESSQPRSSDHQTSRRPVANREPNRRRHHSQEGWYL